MMQQPGATMAPPPQQQQYQYQPQQPPYLQPQYQQQQQPATGYYPPQHQYSQTQPTAQDEGVRTLWIGDLQIWMDEAYLYNCFGSAPDVVSVKVIRNKLTGLPGGYGFIEFATRAAAERCLATYNGTKMPSAEQLFKLNWASMGAGEKRADSPEYTIFVGDLAAEVTDYMLQETFRANYPSVKGAKVVTDQVTGRTKGYGFVRFGDETEQLRAMTEMNGQYCSTRPMRVGPAANKQRVQTQASYQTSQGTATEDDPNNTTVFVGNLDPSVAEEHLMQVFGPFGQLQHVKIPVGKRCGFVQFADRACAEEAIRLLNGTQLAGQSIRLSWGRSPANKTADSTQYNNGGYYGYTPGYENYGYAPATAAAAQDPNMYYSGYPGYGNYPPAPQQLPQ